MRNLVRPICFVACMLVTAAASAGDDVQWKRVQRLDPGARITVAVDGKRMSPATLLAYLNRLGGEHGVGRVDLVENRYVGMKSRGVYETTGGTILHVAHRGLESLTMDREVLHLRDSLIPRYAELIYYGYWYSPEREMLQKAFDEAQQDVSGVARVKLYKGSCTVVGRRSDRGGCSTR